MLNYLPIQKLTEGFQKEVKSCVRARNLSGLSCGHIFEGVYGRVLCYLRTDRRKSEGVWERSITSRCLKKTLDVILRNVKIRGTFG